MRHFTLLIVPGLLTLATSLTLISCTQTRPEAEVQSSAKNVSDAKTSGIKTKVLRMGYQQAGDLIRVTKVLEKRLEPVGIKVEWAQFAQGPQLMEAMNVGKIDLGSVGETPPIFIYWEPISIIPWNARNFSTTLLPHLLSAHLQLEDIAVQCLKC